jgi:hypothetical protein
MRSRLFLSMLLAIASALVIELGAPTRAMAQPQDLNCCTFTVNVSLPAACAGAFPLTIVTDWCQAGPFTISFAANGSFIGAVPGGCPPAPFFLSAILPGGPLVLLGGTGTAMVGGCPVTYTVGTDPAGCIVITIV